MSRPRILTVLLSAGLSFFLFSCGQKETDFQIIEENGVSVALNPDHPIPGTDSPRDILFEEEFKLGSTQGDPNYIFGAFISFTVDNEGHIYVLDWRAKTVRKFDPRGKYLFTFGGPGQGPGEFSSPEEIRCLPDGRLMVFEGESQKYSCFAGDGELVGTGRFQKLMFSPYFGLANGDVIATHVKYEPDKIERTLGIFNESCECVSGFYREERKYDPPWPDSSDRNARAKRLAEAISRVAYRPSPQLALDSREDICFGFTAGHEIKIFNSAGRLKKNIRTDLPGRPLREEDRRIFLDVRLPEDISTWHTMDESFRNQIKEGIKFPETMPAFLSLIPMDSGYLMVVRSGLYGQNALVNIFDPSGRYIIEKKLPFSISEGMCRGRRLYTIDRDEDGNKFIKCYSYRLIT